MRRKLRAALSLLTCAAITMTGCAPKQPFFFKEDGDLSHWVGVATQIEHPDVETQSLSEVTNVAQPFTLSNQQHIEIWEVELEQAVQYALENSKVMRTLGGRRANFGQRPQQDESPESLQRAPSSIATVYDPAIIESDPFYGVEGALSAFDAQLRSGLTYAKTDRPQNFTLQGASIFNLIRQQDLTTFNNSLTKRSATGGQWGLSTQTIFDTNNSPIRQVPGDVLQTVDLSVSQPLLQGAGTFFNRIAGPYDPFTGTGTVQFDGVVLARIRTDISLADFEAGVRNLVNEVENSYWDLYFAYRNLEALKVGRDSALSTWQKVYSLYKSETKGGEADKEAQAREQYYFFRSLVETGMSDLYRAESRLRFVMGLAASDGRLIAPTTEPTTAKVVFDWNEIHCEALMRSVELRQQKWRIKQRELELMASKNLLLPRLDASARYRFLGLGDEWWSNNGRDYNGQGNTLRGTNAISGITQGDFQEAELGLNFQMDLGFRRALTTVRQQQLFLARERSVLQDQELELSHQLTEAVRLLDTNYTLVQTIFNRRLAAERQVKSVEAAYKNGTVTFDLLLDAQRRQADAESAYYRALADYNRGIAQVHYRKGSLLEYNNVLLAEGPWPGKAYFDAKRRARERDAGHYIDYGYTRPSVMSRGPVEQHQNAGEVIDGAIINPGQSYESHGELIQPQKAPLQQPVEQPSVLRKPKQLSMSGKPNGSELDSLLVKGDVSNQNVRQTSAYAEVGGDADSTKNKAPAAATQPMWRSMPVAAESEGSESNVRPVSGTPWKASPRVPQGPQPLSGMTKSNETTNSQGVVISRSNPQGSIHEPTTSDSAPAPRRAAAKWQGVER